MIQGNCSIVPLFKTTLVYQKNKRDTIKKRFRFHIGKVITKNIRVSATISKCSFPKDKIEIKLDRKKKRKG
jgi:hypothetical protein